MTIQESKVYTYARMLASDEEICRICGVAPPDLERYRDVIDKGKAEGMVALRYERAQTTARRGGGKAKA